VLELAPDEHMERRAELVGIHDEICHMPMAYHSLIADVGHLIRVLLARALYRPPRLQFMDERTSHVDMATERQVNAAMMGLG
jgi:ATP-binding cassette, subfamily B, bacterial CvaB/MchF/RaxB